MNNKTLGLTILAVGLAIMAGMAFLKASTEDAKLQDIKMEIPPEPPKSQTVLLGDYAAGVYRTLDLETGIVCYYPTGNGVGINCFQFEEGPAETPTANQLARM